MKELSSCRECGKKSKFLCFIILLVHTLCRKFFSGQLLLQLHLQTATSSDFWMFCFFLSCLFGFWSHAGNKLIQKPEMLCSVASECKKCLQQDVRYELAWLEMVVIILSKSSWHKYLPALEDFVYSRKFSISRRYNSVRKICIWNFGHFLGLFKSFLYFIIWHSLLVHF